MGNPNPSLLLGNVQWKLVKQYNIEIFPGMCLTYAIKFLLSILIWAIQIYHYF